MLVACVSGEINGGIVNMTAGRKGNKPGKKLLAAVVSGVLALSVAVPSSAISMGDSCRKQTFNDVWYCLVNFPHLWTFCGDEFDGRMRMIFDEKVKAPDCDFGSATPPELAAAYAAAPRKDNGDRKAHAERALLNPEMIPGSTVASPENDV